MDSGKRYKEGKFIQARLAIVEKNNFERARLKMSKIMMTDISRLAFATMLINQRVDEILKLSICPECNHVINGKICSCKMTERQ